MSQSKLEKASWIGGIVSAIVAIIAIIPSCKTDGQNHEKTFRPTEVSADKTNKSNKIDKASSPLLESVLAAKKIEYTKIRNDELVELTKKALKRDDYVAALEASNSISYSKTRDEMLDLTHCYAIWSGQTEIADAAISKSEYSSTRTEMLLRTSRVKSITPGEGPNEAECPRLYPL